MKRYWDSSVLVNVLQTASLRHLVMEPEQVTRPHTLAETFSTLTGGRLGIRYLPDEAAKMIDSLTVNFEFVELTADETKMALREAQAKGVRGGRIHDWLHAVAAKKAKAKELLTDNLSDFEGLEDGFKIVAP